MEASAPEDPKTYEGPWRCCHGGELSHLPDTFQFADVETVQPDQSPRIRSPQTEPGDVSLVCSRVESGVGDQLGGEQGKTGSSRIPLAATTQAVTTQQVLQTRLRNLISGVGEPVGITTGPNPGSVTANRNNSSTTQDGVAFGCADRRRSLGRSPSSP